MVENYAVSNDRRQAGVERMRGLWIAGIINEC
jgi:hypothetical protein